VHPTFQLSLTILGFLLIPFSMTYAQRPSDKIERSSFNATYLEHLVKVKIDSVREKNNCTPLVSDSILFVASTHHSKYMAAKERMTHTEDESEKTRTPQLRAEFYGAKNYGVGENVLQTPFNTVITSKKGKEFDGSTYNGLATSMVDGWVHSPGHFKNIITPDYTVTGVSVAMHPTKEKIYSTQKFAFIQFKYSFEESKTLFPYSDYVPPPIPMDFEGLDSALLEHKHEWGLKHDKLEECTSCRLIARRPPHITLRVDKNRFILRVENANYVKELIRNKHDGFAVELVEFNDYMCGNPEYFTTPSRRNGQCEINGRVLEPVYRDALYRGYKKRKMKKEIKFLSYITKADSVPFSERIYNYKLEQFDSEYYETKLGSVPKDMNGLWNHNLLYLQDKQVCHVDYFTGYCGEVFYDSLTPQAFPLDTTGAYEFELDQEHLKFEIPFEQGKAVYTKEDIAPLISSLESLDYSIDSIHIRAYSSVEGDSAKNALLQEKRAKSIAGVFQQHQLSEIETKIDTKAEWVHFYRELKASKKWRSLAKLRKTDMRKKLREPGIADSLEFILKSERRAEIDMYCTIHLVDQNLEYYINKEYDNYVDSLNRTKDVKSIASTRRRYLTQLHALYKFTHRAMLDQRIDTSVLAQLNMPPYYNGLPALAEKFFLFDYVYPTAFAKNQSWVEQKEDMLEILMEGGPGSLSEEFQYAYILDQSRVFKHRDDVTREEVQAHFDQLERLKLFYHSNDFAKKNIERLNYNLNMILLNNVFVEEPEANAAGAYESVNELYDWYLKNNRLNDSTAFALGKMAVYYSDVNLALRILYPYRSVDEIEAYSIPLEYSHVSSNKARYYRHLVELSETMETSHWCNMFISDCGLPFQAFDHEELRNVFCEKCQEENAFILDLKK
jgi:uncharacterized protein YkwD